MIGRLLTFVLMPLWVWVVLGGVSVVSLLLMVLVLVIGGATSSVAADLHYQCDSAVGPDPSVTVTATALPAAPRTQGAPVAGVTTAPTTNPYAKLEIEADDTNVSDWQRACVSALKDAPYQNSPLLEGSSGIGAACARQLALARVSATGDVNGSGDGQTAAEFTRSVIYQASVARSTGRCEATSGTAAQAGGRSSGSERRACGQLDGAGVVELPNTIAAQGACGQRVDPSAVSAGDLVFWSYRSNAPTRVGVAVSDSRLVTTDASTGGFVELVIPSTTDVRVKRVLGSER
ncbi:hypothetical protein U3653_05315 [Nocardia sp. CDC186]|uniref:Uncharacterized protein n=1 Tax=Nocardia implantans TaxID=3108168 RepID=A0ABU6APN8_9NOCA|nr:MULTISPECIES: hypothetical protein [unclassified Nocardia]MBF6189776.1 hypothetical protein [Nocardia beijingensis]MEA3526993.1 hypothetical protein [Nocardia sp. CDC192]MEB3509429.1 hypothetical protein [Nocardia sp. CDC186]